MTQTADRTESIFAAAVALPPAERAAYVDEACANSSDLRGRLEALLRAHDRAGHLLDRPGVEHTAAHTPSEQPGAVIAGRYKLLEAIGEGGMGAVWVAEQIEPVRRKVALKLIKAGMDSKSVLARFEAERQALAVMDHPNIAKVLDGGLTETGRPFFVMEYVKGVPITEYCDAVRLSVPERLQLFVQVCQAVQHAHQKGIIHRDLKPSNILVAPYDDQPVPKVIDFGLAKAMHQPLTERTLHTAHETVLGTPLYMSPEQAQLNNFDVDTRSDVYSLGVLLYELLTGTTPLEKQRFKAAAWDEVRRIIREEDPPRPSLRLSSAQTLPSLAAGRQTELARLTKLVRGELDWIVMKALEKDRSRRYDTPHTLARDVQRYLADEVVEARPPSARYRMRKFARRHRVALTTATAFALLLFAAAVVSSWLAMKAKRAEAVAEEKRIEAEENAAKAEANAKEAERYAEAFWKESSERLDAVVVTEIRSLGLQIDLDLAELRTDPMVGLLRLARPLKHRFGPLHRITPYSLEDVHLDVAKNPRFAELREFATMAVLANGQNYAPLLPPITHDGHAISASYLSSKGDRLLTRGDKTACLWDTSTGRRIATLRRQDEKVIEVGLSPDGTTAFTHSLDGVVRLSETKDGTFRTETEPRPGRIKLEVSGSFDPFEETVSWLPPARLAVTAVSNDRLMTSGTELEIWKTPEKTGVMQRQIDPVELWDSATGRLVARLDAPDRTSQSFQFLGSRWITTLENGAANNLLVFSAEDGSLVASLTHPADETVNRVTVSPSGRKVFTFSRDTVRAWDTSSWQAEPGVVHIGGGFFTDFAVLTDELVATHWLYDGISNWDVYRIGRPDRVFQTDSYQLDVLPSGGDLARLSEGQVYDIQTWQRLLPPPGRKFHPDLARFAPDGRFVRAARSEGSVLIDTRTDKVLPTLDSPWHILPALGMIAVGGDWIRLIPPASKLDLAPELLELWAQVAVRGELSEEGQFLKWDEPTWQRKREQLAAAPAPHPDFPFPGHVAKDKVHWLRAEFGEATTDEDKLRLARELMRRAEAAGDRAEAVRWRAELEKRVPTVAPAPQ